MSEATPLQPTAAQQAAIRAAGAQQNVNAGVTTQINENPQEAATVYGELEQGTAESSTSFGSQTPPAQPAPTEETISYVPQGAGRSAFFGEALNPVVEPRYVPEGAGRSAFYGNALNPSKLVPYVPAGVGRSAFYGSALNPPKVIPYIPQGVGRSYFYGTALPQPGSSNQPKGLAALLQFPSALLSSIEFFVGKAGDFLSQSSQGYESLKTNLTQTAQNNPNAFSAFGQRFLAGEAGVGAGFVNFLAVSFGKPSIVTQEGPEIIGEGLGLGASALLSGASFEALGISTISTVGKAAVTSAAISAGIQELVSGGKATSSQLFGSIVAGAEIGEVGSGVVASAARALNGISPAAAALLAKSGVSGFAARSLFGGAVNVGFTLPFSQNPETLAENFLIGVGFSGPGELLGSAIKGQLEPLLPGGPEIATEAGTTLGRGGVEVPVYKTNPLEAIGNKTVRVVPSVTENEATARELRATYAGEAVPTAHATLEPEKFNLGPGGETILKGIPGGARGFRLAEQISPFYSAPGVLENPTEGLRFYRDLITSERGNVTIYGGYSGIGEGEVPRVVFGGKPTALVTGETYVEDIARSSNETEEEFLSRYLGRSGKTSVGVENLIEKSTERQLETTTQYERFGEQLPGSKFVSEGKLLRIQVRQSPDDLFFKNVPGLRGIENALRTRYTLIDLYGGRFEPTTGGESSGKTLELGSYNAGLEESAFSLRGERITSGLALVAPRGSTSATRARQPSTSVLFSFGQSSRTAPQSSTSGFSELLENVSISTSSGEGSSTSSRAVDSIRSTLLSLASGPSVASNIDSEVSVSRNLFRVSSNQEFFEGGSPSPFFAPIRNARKKKTRIRRRQVKSYIEFANLLNYTEFSFGKVPKFLQLPKERFENIPELFRISTPRFQRSHDATFGNFDILRARSRKKTRGRKK